MVAAIMGGRSERRPSRDHASEAGAEGTQPHPGCPDREEGEEERG